MTNSLHTQSAPIQNNPLKRIKVRIALYGESTTELRSVTCHMGSHSVTCYPTQESAPRLNPSHAGRYSIYLPRGMEGWVDLVTRKRSCQESNSRPLGPESNALTTEPPSNLQLQFHLLPTMMMKVRMDGHTTAKQQRPQSAILRKNHTEQQYERLRCSTLSSGPVMLQ